MNESSVLELNHALTEIMLSSARDDGRNSIMARGVKAASALSDHFVNINNSVSAAWDTAGDLFYKITAAVAQEVEGIYQVINKFCEETYTIEGQATKAAETANTQAEAILKELGL